MPKLPDLNSLGARPTPSPNSTIIRGDQSAVADAMTRAGSGLANTGDNMLKVAERNQEKQADYNTAQARAYMARQAVTLSNAFDEDNDYTTFEPRLNKQWGEALQQASAMVDPKQRALFNEQAALDYERARQTVLGVAKKKEGDYGRATLADNLTQNLEGIISAKDEADRVALINASKGLIQTAQQKNWIDAEQANQQWQGFRTKAVDGNYEAMIAKDPERVVRELAPVPVDKSKTVSRAAEAVQQAVTKHGANADALMRTIMLESGGNPDAVSPTGATGVMQFTGRTARQYGLTDRNDLEASIDKGAQLQVDNIKVLKNKLGREPEGPEIYLAHQQGATGASALIKADPNANARQVLEDIGADPDNITNNGGTRDMTVGEFVQKYRDRYENVQMPTHIFETTGATSDLVDPSRRQKMYKSAAELVVQDAITQNPERVTEVLARPEIQGAFTAREQADIKKQAVENFKAKDENARGERMMAHALKNTEIGDAFIAGTLTPARLAQAEANSEVTPEYANYIRKSMMANVPERTIEEKNNATLEIANAFMELGVVNKPNKPATATASMQAILDFQNQVMNSVAQGYITANDAKTYLKNVAEPLAARIGDPEKRGGADNKPGWYQSQENWMKKNPILQGFQMIDTWAAGGTKTDNVAQKAEVMRKYTGIMQRAADSNQTILPQEGARQAIVAYLQEKYPMVAMSGQVPNALVRPDGTRQNALPGKAEATPQASVPSLYKIVKDANGNMARKFTDGRYEPLGGDEMQRLKALGY